MQTVTELTKRIQDEAPGSLRSYLLLEYHIAVAVEFADMLRENEGLRSPVEIEFDALLSAAAELGRSVRRLAR